MSGHFGTKHNRTPVCKVCGKEPKYRAGLCRMHYFAAQRERRAEKRRVRASHCAHCDKLMESPSLRQQFCSRRCVEAARNIRNRKLPVVDRATCNYCKTEFSPLRPWQRFCGEACVRKAKNARLYGKRKPPATIAGNCLECGSPFTQPRRMYVKRLSVRQPKFCSLQCAYKARRGAGSQHFRGGSIAYRGVQWVNIAAEIRARDEFLCRACGKLPKVKREHCVDHIIPFRLMKQWGLDPNQYDNLLTVCDSCHGRKFASEGKLLRGDLLGFLRGLVAIAYPVERIRAACAVAELSTKGLPNAA
jgi:5-methylcytosine-specific restriction endonuclease McrA